MKDRESQQRQRMKVRRALVLAEALEPRQLLANFLVTNINDAGTGSFRQAIIDANNAASGDTISFDAAGVFATSQTINSLTALPQITAAGGALTITGTGASNLTIRRDPGAIAFRVLDSAAPTLNLSGLTISNGNVTGKGGGLFSTGTNATVNLDGVVFSGNASSQEGGAIYINTAGFLSIRNSTISGNTAATDGGGIYTFSGGGLLIENSTVSGNTANSTSTGGGGIYFFGTPSASPPPGFTPSTVVVRNSTISGNTSAANGGGIFLPSFAGTLQLQNTTVSGNTAATSGGGIFQPTGSGSILVQNSTISNNTANGTAINTGGGGIARLSTTAGNITIANSVVSGNNNANGPDILATAATTTNANFSAIGSGTAFTPSATSGNNLPFGTNLMLGALANNGGPTLTMLPSSSSPLINAGSNALVPAGLTTDQRGAAYDRISSSTVDIGSLEVQPEISASASATNITTSGGTIYTFTVIFSDNHAVNVATVIGNNSAIRVTGPGGFDVPATYISIDNSTNGTPRVATYAITPPGGSWDPSDGGVYTITMQGNQVRDVDGISIPAGSIGSFTVSIPQTLIVTNINDNGTGSLRNAITVANASPADDTIVFDTAGVFATLQTISLLGALSQFPLTGGGLTINGTGASRLTVRRDPAASNFRIFDSLAPTLSISGLTISGGNVVGDGGGLLIGGTARTTTLDGVILTGNSASLEGGAINLNTGNFLTVRSSTISGNTAGTDGGGIYFFSGGSLVLENSTVSGNTANSTSTGGGGIYFFGTPSASPPPGFTPGTVVVRNSTISGNTSAANGGGIFLPSFAGTLQLQNTTISGNTAATSGGGVFQPTGSGSILVQNSTIASNTANGSAANTGGGGIARLSSTAGSITVQNSVISGNNNANAPDILASAATTTNANFSAIGSGTAFTPSATSGNNLPFGTNLILGALANNGGPTLTRAPQSGSPLIGAGSNALVPAGLTTDQRGIGFARTSGSSVDIGAIEIDAIRPAVVTFNFNYVSGPQSLRYTFSEPVNLTASALELLNVTTGAIIPTSKIVLSYDLAGNTATFTFPGYPNGVLPDGDYRVLLPSSGVSDFSGNHPVADHMMFFYFLLGDLNHDRQVSIADFITLASNFNKTGALYTEGDLNYDLQISIADFIDLASKFGSFLQVPPPSAPQPAAAQQITPAKIQRRRHHRRVKPRSPSKEPVRIVPLFWRV